MVDAGMEVNWVRSSSDGTASRAIATRVVSLETISRTDGTSLSCAVLECNRFVPVCELHPLTVQRDAGQRKFYPPSQRTVVPPPVKADTVQMSDGREERAAAAESGKVSAAVPQSAVVAECRVLAIDFMNLLVRAWHAGKPTDTHAVRSMFQTVANAVKTLRPEFIVFALDGGHDHRTRLLPAYKAHRPPHDPNLVRQIALAENALQIAGLQSIRMPGFEADDVLATIGNSHSGVVICSSDKDLLAMHGRCRIYHPWGAGAFVDPAGKLGVDAGQVTDYLALCGDTSDGVPGVKGIGPKTAAELLDKYGSLETIIINAKLQRIPGATGRRLRELHADAFLCHEVIRLRSNLPIPELQPWKPAHGFYQSQLQAIGLGSVAAILDALTLSLLAPKTPSPVPARDPVKRPQLFSDFDDEVDDKHESKTTPAASLSATTGKVELAKTNETGNPVRPESATVPVQLRQDEARSAAAHTTVTSPANPARDSGSEAIRPLPGITPVSGTDNYARAGFTDFRESPPPPGTDMMPKLFARWRDGSRWLLDSNSRKHTCISDSPITCWTIDRRGPVDPKTNAVRGSTRREQQP